MASYAAQMSLFTVAEALAGILAEHARMAAIAGPLHRPSVPLRTLNGFRRLSPHFTKGSLRGWRPMDPSRTFPRRGRSSSWRTPPTRGMGHSSELLQPSPWFAPCKMRTWRLSAWHTSSFRGLCSFGTPNVGRSGTPPALANYTDQLRQRAHASWCHLAGGLIGWFRKQVSRVWSWALPSALLAQPPLRLGGTPPAGERLVSSVCGPSSRLHMTHRIRLPRPGWAERRHTAAGTKSIGGGRNLRRVALVSPTQLPPPPMPEASLGSAPQCLYPGTTRCSPSREGATDGWLGHRTVLVCFSSRGLAAFGMAAVAGDHRQGVAVAAGPQPQSVREQQHGPSPNRRSCNRRGQALTGSLTGAAPAAGAQPQ